MMMGDGRGGREFMVMIAMSLRENNLVLIFLFWVVCFVKAGYLTVTVFYLEGLS